MLAIQQRESETILLCPLLDIDPDMTVADLFKNGPIRIGFSNIRSNQARIVITVPDTLQIVHEELACYFKHTTHYCRGCPAFI